MPRFMRKGRTRFYYAPTIASAALAPTAAEITAGLRLDTELAEVNGFTFANSPIQVPDMASAFVSSIPGEDSVEDSNLIFYELDTATNPISVSQAKGINGYICIFYKGVAGAAPAAADKCDVWPIQIASNARQYTADNEAAKYQVTYTPTAVPGFDKAVT
jgi:hypothetical protein